MSKVRSKMANSVWLRLSQCVNEVRLIIHSIINKPGHFSSPVPALAFQPSCITESESAVSEDGKSESVGDKLSEIFDGLLWTALPKKRVSRDRRRMRRHGENKIEKYATPRTNITACLECGHWHMIHTVCGNCYEKVRKETELMKEAMGEDALKYNAPHTEVAYVYKGEEADKAKLGGKRIIEMAKERPDWWPKNLLTRPGSK